MARIRATGGGRQMGPVGLIIFGVFWTAFSSIFLGIGLWTTWKAFSQSTWEKVPCVIERFEIKADRKNDKAFQTDLRFRYDWQGESHVGTQLRPDDKGYDDFEKLAESREQLLAESGRDDPAGLRTECRVDPKHPESASLLPPSASSWFGIMFAFVGGCFVLIGLGLIRSAVRNRKQTALSDRTSQANQNPIPMGVFFSVFALAGLGVTFGLVVPGATRYFSAKSWSATPATVIWSRIVSHSGSKGGTTYSVDVFYRYQFRGREYRSNRYGLMSSGSSGRDSKQDKVNSLPPNTKFTCYVNPQTPWQAVIKRDLGASAFFALFPLPFLAVGFGGLYWTVKKRRAAKSQTATSGSNPHPAAELATQDLPELVFSGGKSRWLNLFGTLVACAFWNGIVSIFIGVAWSAWKRGHPETFLMIFLIPFVLIGAFLLLSVPYRLLMLFLTRYQMCLTPGTLKPGGAATLSWKRLGGFGQPKSLTFRLIGTESATFQGGKNSSTSTSVFHDEILAEISAAAIADNLPISLQLPETAPPTFEGTSTKILWKLRLVTAIPGFPKITDDHDLDVRPLRRDELAP